MHCNPRMPAQVPWTACASLAGWLIVILTAPHMGGAIARWFGFPDLWGSLAAESSVAVVNLGLLLVQELPRQGVQFMFRWLMGCACGVGWLALIWSAMHVRYDLWAVLFGSCHVLLAIGLVLLLGWVSAGRAMSAIVFTRTPKAVGKPPGGVADRWHD